MNQENRSGDRSATSRLAEAELLPLQTTKLCRPPVTIQQQPQEATENANWLPAPAGRFRVAIRIYQPREAVLDGTWQAPAIKRVE